MTESGKETQHLRKLDTVLGRKVRQSSDTLPVRGALGRGCTWDADGGGDCAAGAAMGRKVV